MLRGEMMKDHALIIDYKYCTGCHSCEVACKNIRNIGVGEWGIHLESRGPVEVDGKWHWDYHPVPTTLCNLCEDRIAAGEKPSCVQHCLAQCMEVVTVDEVSSTLKKYGDGVSCYIPV